MYKVGQKVKLRNGDTATLTGSLKGTNKVYGIALSPQGFEYVVSWDKEDGRKTSPLLSAEDIVEFVQNRKE